MAPDRPASRFSAHLALDNVGQAGQDRISASRVVLVGLGGLGCPVAQYLAGCGVGALHICDFDTVSMGNLARQLLYSPADVGRLKTEAAAEALARINPDMVIHQHDVRADRALMEEFGSACDLVIDASDNYGTRLSVNRACLQMGKPWVMGSCVRMEGQVMLFRPGAGEQPCYRCVYGAAPDSLEDCPGAGVFAPAAGMIGTLMAHLALGLLAGLDFAQGLHILDGGGLSWKTLQVVRNPACPECALSSKG